MTENNMQQTSNSFKCATYLRVLYGVLLMVEVKSKRNPAATRDESCVYNPVFIMDETTTNVRGMMLVTS